MFAPRLPAATGYHTTRAAAAYRPPHDPSLGRQWHSLVRLRSLAPVGLKCFGRMRRRGLAKERQQAGRRGRGPAPGRARLQLLFEIPDAEPEAKLFRLSFLPGRRPRRFQRPEPRASQDA